MSRSTYERFPVEIYLLIAGHLSFADRRQLASTTRELNALFARDLFSALRFTNRDTDEISIQRAVSKYGQQVQHLSFKCYLYSNSGSSVTGSDEVERRYKSRDLPHWTCALLSGKALKSPRSIRIEFIELGNSNDVCYPWADLDGHDFLETGVLGQVWSALSTNTSILHLEIHELIPREVSVWSSRGWHSFLSQLQTLSLELCRMELSTGWGSYCLDEYFSLEAALDKYFFIHAQNLIRLQLKADRHNPHRCEYWQNTLIGYKHLPKLKELELEGCVIDFALLCFLTCPSKSLHSLVLKNCLEHPQGMQFSQISWAYLFSAVRERKTTLRKLELLNCHSAGVTGKYGPDLIEMKHKEVNLEKVIREQYRCTNPKGESGVVFGWTGPGEYKFATERDITEFIELQTMVMQNAEIARQQEAANLT